MTETKWGVDTKKKKRTTILAETAHFNSCSLLPFFFFRCSNNEKLTHTQTVETPEKCSSFPHRRVHLSSTVAHWPQRQYFFLILPHQHYPYLDAGAVEKKWWYVLVLVQYWAEFLDVLKWCKGSFGRNNDIRSEPGAQKRGCGHQMQLLFINIHKQLYRELSACSGLLQRLLPLPL